MRILAASDLHGRTEDYHWIIDQAVSKQVHALVLAGDLLRCAEGFDDPRDAQAANAGIVLNILEKADIPIFHVMGNDDLIEINPRSDKMRSLHGKRIDHGGFNFVGYQYSLPFVGGIFEKPEDEIEEDLVELESLIGDRTVMVTHCPAHGILDPGFFGHRIGSISLGEMLGRTPFRAHIHGHSHAGFGAEGRHFNVASGDQLRAMVIDLESMTHEMLKEER